jgi:hypothetical protein
MRRILLLTTAVMALAGCDLSSEPAGTDKAGPASDTAASAPSAGGSFAHSQTEDLSGYYRVGEPRVGPADFALMQLFVGQAREFRDWEEGRRTATFAPVMLEFQGPGETPERVLPESYAVSDGQVRMTGKTSAGERVTFVGRMNAGALATARRNLGGGEAPAVTAVVVVGDQTWSGVKLSWYGGD